MKTNRQLRRLLYLCVCFLALIYLSSGCQSKEEKTEIVADYYTPTDADWPVYLGDKAGTHFSSLDQINLQNVGKLKVAWTYASGGASPENRSQIQCNPLIINGVLYGTNPQLNAFALHAATGEELWKFEATEQDQTGLGVNRGLVYWQKGEDARILFSAGPFLYALDARTGKPIPGFGQQGKVSLKEGLGGLAENKFVLATSPGVVYQDLIIMGSRVSENADAAPGYIRAFNIVTGKLEWVFHTIPRPGEVGYETWPPDAWKTIGGANAWAGMTLDEGRGIVYVPTGSAAYDFWGGNRKGENLFANCMLALDAKTGKRIWHYQTVRHDIWDRDLPCPPTLVTVVHDGKTIDALAQPTKSGFVFVLNRETGEPLFPIEEMATQPSDLEGEEAWISQPIPMKPAPFSRQKFTEEDITNISKSSADHVRNILKKVRTGEPFIPPSMEGTIIFPGFDGGAEWGGAAWDQQSGLLYLNANEMPWILTMIEVGRKDLLANTGQSLYMANCAICHGAEMQGDPTGTYPPVKNMQAKYARNDLFAIINNGKGVMPAFNQLSQSEKRSLVAYLLGEDEPKDPHETGKETNQKLLPYSHTGYNRFLDPEGYPAVKPPWGTLNAIDLNAGEIVWQVPLGEFDALTQRGIPITGTENYGGPVITAGGLLFVAATKDEKFRAFDAKTGKVVWETKLPAGGYATPSTYMVNGKQYIVIACGGGKMGTPSGDQYVAFALD
jgi:quinoprotein glucose dehydrogenase